jgi:hypothetical protein
LFCWKYLRTKSLVNVAQYRVYLHTDMCLQTLTHIQFWTTVAFLRCCNLIWGLINNNYSLYFLQFLTIGVNLRLCYIFSAWNGRSPNAINILNESWIAIFAYMNIFDMRTMILCYRNEKKINQMFVLLKLASDKKFGQHFP